MAVVDEVALAKLLATQHPPTSKANATIRQKE